MRPLEFQSWPAAYTAATGADFSLEKSQLGRFCGRNPQDFSRIWRRWRGDCFPAHQLTQKSIWTSQSPETLCLRASDCRKTQREHERDWGHWNSNRGRRRERRPRVLIFPWKNRSLADFAAGIHRISAKSGEGGGGLIPCPPACQKVYLDKLNPPAMPGDNSLFVESAQLGAW